MIKYNLLQSSRKMESNTKQNYNKSERFFEILATGRNTTPSPRERICCLWEIYLPRHGYDVVRTGNNTSQPKEWLCVCTNNIYPTPRERHGFSGNNTSHAREKG